MSANPRARVAFRAAWSALIAWVLGSYLAIASSHVNHLMVALTCVISFATPMQQLGDTCRNGFIWVTSAIVLAPLGTATCYLCFLLGGMEWNHWILAIGRRQNMPMRLNEVKALSREAWALRCY